MAATDRDTERARVIEEALNAAVLVIQKALGVDDGGFASMWFTGPEEDAALGVLGRYYDAEVAFAATFGPESSE